MKNIKEILKKKHLLVIGKTEVDRKNFITEIIKTADYETFRFPAKMATFDDYFYAMKKMQLYEPWYEAKRYNGHAIWDFHEAWIYQNNSLIVLEEVQNMEVRWKNEIIRIYINVIDYKTKGKDTVHLIISQNEEANLIEELANSMQPIRNNERRTKKQIVEQNLQIIDIGKN